MRKEGFLVPVFDRGRHAMGFTTPACHGVYSCIAERLLMMTLTTVEEKL